MENVGFYVIAFFSTIFFILLFRKPAERLGLVDLPSRRKNHKAPVPVIGGLAIFAAFVFGALASEEPLREFSALFAGLLILVLVGVMDDTKDLTARSRLIAQIFVALLMTSWGGIFVEDLGNLFGMGSVHLQNWAIPFTVFSVIGVINAFNMLDGADGLAGGVSLVSLSLLGSVALFFGSGPQSALIFTLASAVLGFLAFNMRSPWRTRAAVFMGDAGSMMLGFALVWFAVEISRIISPVAILWIFAIPLMDTGNAVLRRTLKGHSPFSADREHLHHVIMRSGLSATRAVLLIVLVSFLLGLVGLAGWSYQVPEYLMFYTFMILCGCYYLVMNHAGRLAKLWRKISVNHGQ